MTPDSFVASNDFDDFQRWFFGGSPPECDAWEPHAFENALQGMPSVSGSAGLGATPSKSPRLQLTPTSPASMSIA